MEHILAVCGIITSLAAAVAVIVRCFVWMKRLTEGQKCQLRSEMLRIYYKHADEKGLRQYEFENFSYLYKAYKALGGNSFIDRIGEEVDTWKIVS